MMYRREKQSGFAPTPKFVRFLRKFILFCTRFTSQIYILIFQKREHCSQHKNWCRGFTLVEVLVYIAVLLTVAFGAIGLLLSLDSLFARFKAEQKINRSATIAIERMLHDIRDAESVSAFSYTHPGSLTLAIDGDMYQYATSGDALHITVNGTDTGPLTESGVKVSQFQAYSYSNVSEFTRIALTLSTTVGDVTVSETYNVGAVLRGSYEE